MTTNWPYAGTRLLLSAEGSSGGRVDKSSQSDQRQLQSTSQSGDVIGADGSINRGTSISGGTVAGGVNITDQGAVNSAFSFGANVVAEVGKVFANEAATQRDTVAANTAGLNSFASLISQNSAGGIAAQNNKTILYVVGAALAVVGLIIFLRR
jgi:hypothetical protein